MKEKVLAAEGPVRVVGTMSGTSLDGVDAAELVTDGDRIMAFGASAYRAYDPGERAVLRAALGRWPGEDGVARAAEVVEAAHVAVLQGFPEAVLVGFHGQTLAHDPAGRGTHQTGDGARLARSLGRPVVWDFRSADVAAGGQGAPLAPAFHFALARHIGAVAPLAVLNLGGVGNLTWIDPTAPEAFAPGAMLAFDTGPANAPIDDLIRSRLGRDRDEGGALALSGRADGRALEPFRAAAYFDRMPPKSLDRDDFAQLGSAVAGLSDADAAATLVEAVALSVARGFDWCPVVPGRLLVTGGGRHNPAIMARLRALLPCTVLPVEAAGLDGDMLEAQAFAYLAVRAARDLPLSGPSTTGAPRPLSGGRLSDPQGDTKPEAVRQAAG